MIIDWLFAFLVFMRLQNYNLTDHPILKDIERIRSYMQKVRQAESTEEERAKVRLNAQAAQRFIRNSLWQPPTKRKHEEPSSCHPTE